ncbi:MAG: hypothetical protein PHC48_11500 [Prevotella sp.]|nr:hypothetical protein [Prevotella sp.]
MVKHIKQFNPKASPSLADKHLLRPRPHAFLDQPQNADGTNLGA